MKLYPGLPEPSEFPDSLRGPEDFGWWPEAERLWRRCVPLVPGSLRAHLQALRTAQDRAETWIDALVACHLEVISHEGLLLPTADTQLRATRALLEFFKGGRSEHSTRSELDTANTVIREACGSMPERVRTRLPGLDEGCRIELERLIAFEKDEAGTTRSKRHRHPTPHGVTNEQQGPRNMRGPNQSVTSTSAWKGTLTHE